MFTNRKAVFATLSILFLFFYFGNSLILVEAAPSQLIDDTLDTGFPSQSLLNPAEKNDHETGTRLGMVENDSSNNIHTGFEDNDNPYETVYWGTPGLRSRNPDSPLIPGAVIPPEDGRVQISGTNITPYSQIAHLELNYGPSILGRCTGWFIGPHTIITAGHCVYDHIYGWTTEIRVIPGRNAATEPFGSITITPTITNVVSTDGWVLSGYSAYDYAAITLPDDKMGNATGWFEYGYFSDEYLLKLSPTLTGYPGDKPLGTMWADIDPITSVTEYFVRYTIDTAAGQSGSPVYHLSNSNFVAVAVHTLGFSSAACQNDVDANCGTRINKEVADLFYSWGAMSLAKTDCSVLGVPSLLQPGSGEYVEDRPASFDWTFVDFNDGYQFELYKDSISNLVLQEDVIGSANTVDGLTIGTYYWRVRANNISGCPAGTFTGFRSFNIAFPSVPLSVQASDGTSATTINISSFQADYANIYHFLRATDFGGPYTDIGTNASDSVFSDSTTEALRTYYYRMYACNDYGCSGYSAIDSGWRMLPPPGALDASDTDYSEIAVSWETVPDATVYMVYRAQSLLGTKTFLDSMASTSYADTLAIAGVTYYYWVKACNNHPNNGGCSGFSAYDTGIRLINEVSNVNASDGLYTSTTFLTWGGNPATEIYKVWRAINPKDEKTLLGTTGIPQFHDTIGNPGQVYHYFVQSCIAASCGPFTSDTGWRAMAAPTYIEASDGLYPDHIAVQWGAVGDATFYEIYRSKTYSGTQILIGSPVDANFNDETVLPGETYHYWVKGCNELTCSDPVYDSGYILIETRIYLPIVIR